MVHDDYKEMISAHALSTLDEPEERVLSEHLSGCAECRLEFESWQATTATLSLTCEPMTPSAQLRERILAQARAEGRSANVAATERLPAEPESAKVLPFNAAPRNVWNSLGTFGAIAAALLFVALMAGIVMLWQENRSIRERLATVQAEQARMQEFQALVGRPDSRMVKLSGTKDANTANAMFAFDKTGHAMLMAQGLPLAPDKVYQLWFIVGDKPMPGKVFTIDQAGSGSLIDEVPDVAREKAVFAVTLEPTRVPSPTGPIVLSGSL